MIKFRLSPVIAASALFFSLTVQAGEVVRKDSDISDSSGKTDTSDDTTENSTKRITSPKSTDTESSKGKASKDVIIKGKKILEN